VPKSPRYSASVCSGAYLLAEAGLLDGKRATTHWARSAELQKRYPKVRVEAARIFVRGLGTFHGGGLGRCCFAARGVHCACPDSGC